ncbi:hypothetical protein XENOCAPTIV_004588 [Xenoophorus captivus]|uniref:Uncharacterized protein n=1 Tax=Xenoophorus captivus TaxID=1517983 RepID=A0ABV0SC19_9TELE
MPPVPFSLMFAPGRSGPDRGGSLSDSFNKGNYSGLQGPSYVVWQLHPLWSQSDCVNYGARPRILDKLEMRERNNVNGR